MDNYIPNDNDNCVDCKVNTIIIGEYYMLHRCVWQYTGLGVYDGMLCISCVEKRIGRQLTSDDFSDFPINTSSTLFRSQLLISRMQNMNDNLVGKRIQLIHCTDEYTKLKPGVIGTITFIDDIGTVFVNWDDGSTLGLIPRIDKWKVL